MSKVIDLPEAYKLLCEDPDRFVHLEAKIPERKGGEKAPLAYFYRDKFCVWDPSKDNGETKPREVHIRITGAIVSMGAKKLGEGAYAEGAKENRKISIHGNKSYTPPDKDEPTNLFLKFVEKYIEIRNKKIKEGLKNKSIPLTHGSKNDSDYKSPITTHHSDSHETKPGEEMVDENGKPDPLIGLSYNFGPYPPSFSNAGQPKFSVEDFAGGVYNKETDIIEYPAMVIDGKVVDDENVHKAIKRGSELQEVVVRFVTIKSKAGITTRIEMLPGAVIDNSKCQELSHPKIPNGNLLAKMMKAKERAEANAKNKEEIPIEEQEPETPSEDPLDGKRKGASANEFIDGI